MPSPQPVIKGMFVKSHIEAVRKAKGEAGVAELERRYGKPLKFRHMQYVPVREEVKIIEHTLDILSPAPVPAAMRAFEAGRLHFRNFRTTSYGKIIFSSLPKNCKPILMNAKYIAQHVFRHVKFTSIDLGPQALKIIMENNDYPIDHFKGLFYEWMRFFDLKRAKVDAKETVPNIYEYTMVW